MTALAYVDLNPVRAAMVGDALAYPWSSARAHVEGRDESGLLDMDLWREVRGHGRWAEMLFSDVKGRRLREPVWLALVPWRKSSKGPDGAVVSLEEVEEQAIELAIAEFEDIVLNVRGEVWWRPAARVARPVNAALPRRRVDWAHSCCRPSGRRKPRFCSC